MKKGINQDSKLSDNENKKSNRYNFYSSKTDGIYDVIKNKMKIYVFYQLCLFMNDKYNKYNIRKIYYDDGFNILDVREYMIPKNDYMELIDTLPKQKYMTYATFNLKIIDIPCEGELIMATSELLSNNINYYGYANIN